MTLNALETPDRFKGMPAHGKGVVRVELNPVGDLPEFRNKCRQEADLMHLDQDIKRMLPVDDIEKTAERLFGSSKAVIH